MLLEQHWDYVYKYLLGQTNDVFTSEEICIQTFAKAFDRIDQYDEKYVFKTWLITISKRLLIDDKRKRELETTKIDNQVNAMTSEENNIEDDLIQKQYVNTVKTALSHLKPNDRKVLEKRLFEDKTYAEIALDMGESVNFIKVKILRARKKLAQKISL